MTNLPDKPRRTRFEFDFDLTLAAVAAAAALALAAWAGFATTASARSPESFLIGSDGAAQASAVQLGEAPRASEDPARRLMMLQPCVSGEGCDGSLGAAPVPLLADAPTIAPQKRAEPGTTPVPLPAALALLGAGMAIFGVLHRRRGRIDA